MNFVLFDRAVRLMDSDHETQSKRRRGDTDHDRGQNEHVWERIGVDRISLAHEDRGCAAPNLAHADVQDEDGRLENAQPDDLLD